MKRKNIQKTKLNIKRKKLILSGMTGLMVCALLTGCGVAKTQNTVASSSSQQQTSISEETKASIASKSKVQTQTQTQAQTQTQTQTQSQANTQPQAQSETGDKHEISGVIVDASMHALVLQSDAGETLDFTLGEDGVDISGLSDGIILGNGITLTYTGVIKGSDTSGAVVTAEKDAKTICTDSAALTAAGEIILSVENKDYDGFLNQCSFPVYVGIGNGNTVNDKNAFEKTYTMQDIFTDQLVQSVSHVNLLEIQEKKGKLILTSEKSGKPGVVLTQKNSKWMISAIYTSGAK